MENRLIAEEFLGPETIEGGNVFEKSVSMPLYLLRPVEYYTISGVVTQKGKTMSSFDSKLVLEKLPPNTLLSKIFIVFLLVSLLSAISAILFIKLIKK